MRDHVIRQDLGDPRPDFIDECCLICRRAGWNQIGAQTLFFPVRCQNHRLPDPITTLQLRFHFTQLDAVAAYFYLLVLPAQELHAAIPVQYSVVACPVNIPQLGMMNKGMAGFIRIIQVAVCHSASPDVQLAGHFKRAIVHLLVEDIESLVG
ncbi:hypothetical protein D3C73_980010 [compost metagenome]